MNRTTLQLLAEYGQSPWLDALSRALLAGGQLERLVREHGVRGILSSSAVLQEAIAAGGHYDAQIQELAAAGEHGPEAILRALAVSDVKHACDLMRPVWEQSGGADGYVSLAVDPRLAADGERTHEQAKLLRRLVDRPNFMVAIAATTAGVCAVEDSIACGIPVNVELICSPERHREVVQAHRRGIERLLEAGGDPGGVAAVSGVCVGRVDIEVDRRLEARGGEAVRQRGRFAIANAKLIYEQHKEAFASPRWRALEARGARPQRCLWTVGRESLYSRIAYLEELVGAETVAAMSAETVEAFERCGVPADRLGRGLDEARRVVREVEAAGVDLADVWATLEADGVRMLVDGFEALLASVRAKRAAARRPGWGSDR